MSSQSSLGSVFVSAFSAYRLASNNIRPLHRHQQPDTRSVSEAPSQGANTHHNYKAVHDVRRDYDAFENAMYNGEVVKTANGFSRGVDGKFDPTRFDL